LLVKLRCTLRPVHHRITTLGCLFDCLDLQFIRVPLAAHSDLPGCHKLWLEDVYERLAGPLFTSAAHNSPRGLVLAPGDWRTRFVAWTAILAGLAISWIYFMIYRTLKSN